MPAALPSLLYSSVAFGIRSRFVRTLPRREHAAAQRCEAAATLLVVGGGRLYLCLELHINTELVL